MTHYPIPPKAEKPDPLTKQKKAARQKLLAEVRRKRAEILKKFYKR